MKEVEEQVELEESRPSEEKLESLETLQEEKVLEVCFLFILFHFRLFYSTLNIIPILKF